MSATNKEGLTLQEWLDAANLGAHKLTKQEALKPWREGEDPSEYAARSKED